MASPAFEASFDPIRAGRATLRAGARFQLRDGAVEPDDWGRVGPIVQLEDGERQVAAALVFDRGTQGYGWILVGGGFGAGDLGEYGEVWFPVDPYREHLVELFLVGAGEAVPDVTSRAVLVVNEEVVDDVPLDRFTTASADVKVTIGVALPSATEMVNAWVRDGFGEVTYSDLQQRRAFVQAMADTLIFPGGGERNDHLELWSQRALGVENRRGTYNGLRTEYRRMALDDTIDLHSEVAPAGWFLDVSFPDVTPIFLDDPGMLRDTWIEFYDEVPNYPPDRFCKLIHRYLAPFRALENDWHCGLIVDVSAVVTTGTESTLTVDDVGALEVGDDVTVRQAFAYTGLTIEYVAGQVDEAWIAIGPSGSLAGGWMSTAPATGGTAYVGTFTQTGRQTDRTNTITNGAVVKIAAAGVGITGVAVVVGLRSGSGLPDYEEIDLNGVVDVIGVKTWSQLHGVFLDGVKAGNVTVRDNTDNDLLYTVTAGDNASGCVQANPSLTAPDIRFGINSPAADFILFGIDKTGAVKLEHDTLAGIAGTTATYWRELRGMALGYTLNANTITFTSHAADPAGEALVVSNNAGDVQQAFVLGVDPTWTRALREVLTLNGVANVTGTTTFGRILGTVLLSDAIGTITVSQVGGTKDITIGTIAPAARALCARRTETPCRGAVRMRLSAANVDRVVYAVVLGFRADTDDYDVELFRLTGREWVTGEIDWSRVFGVASGDAVSEDLEIEGLAWFGSWVDVQVQIGAMTEWELVGIDDNFKPYGKLTPLEKTAADAGPVTIDGFYDVFEPATIATVVDPDTITTSVPLENTFSAGAVVRKEV